MKHLRPLIIANWKMNPPILGQALRLARIAEDAARKSRNVEVVVAPPFPYLAAVRQVLKYAKLGAQNCAANSGGAFTGEVSAVMLKSLGVSYVILGHSERRRFFQESDETIHEKLKRALGAGISAVLAVGEEARESQEVIPPAISRELKGALDRNFRRASKKITVAYEPLWAIGTGRPDRPDNAMRRAIYIRKTLSSILGPRAIAPIRVLYGGSVNAKNVAAFLMDDIRGMEGLLVGGASLKTDEFSKIVRKVAEKFRHR